MPGANDLALHIIAAMVQYEDKLSANTPNRLRKLTPPPATIETMRPHRSGGLTYRGIAAQLNEMNVSTPKSRRYSNGYIWRPGMVHTAMLFGVRTADGTTTAAFDGGEYEASYETNLGTAQENDWRKLETRPHKQLPKRMYKR